MSKALPPFDNDRVSYYCDVFGLLDQGKRRAALVAGLRLGEMVPGSDLHRLFPAASARYAFWQEAEERGELRPGSSVWDTPISELLMDDSPMTQALYLIGYAEESGLERYAWQTAKLDRQLKAAAAAERRDAKRGYHHVVANATSWERI